MARTEWQMADAKHIKRLRCLLDPDHSIAEGGHRALDRRVNGNTKGGPAVVPGRAADDLAFRHSLAELDRGLAGSPMTRTVSALPDSLTCVGNPAPPAPTTPASAIE